jgi:predicted Rossmann fold flavoprotein
MDICMNKEKKPVIAVIGGGPAGLMAAGVAGESGASVLLFETNAKCGRKLLLTGSGKCNITNTAPMKEFLEHFPENRKFLYPSFKHFFTEDLERFFNQYGLFFQREDNNNGKIFPQDHRAATVLEVLLTYCQDNQVDFHLSEPVRQIKKGEAWEIVTDKGVYPVTSAIIATGGLSYPGTGSAGSGYLMAESLGISIEPTRPALVPLVCADKWCRELTGISLEGVKTSLWESAGGGSFRKIISMSEDILFTHFGVSGPAALSISRWIKSSPKSCDKDLQCDYRLTIDLCPERSAEDVEKLLLEVFSQSPNKLLRSVISRNFGLPNAVSSVLVRLCTPIEDIYCRDTTREIRRKMISMLKSLPLTVLETKGYNEAMVTAGGVSTRELDPRTMGSRRNPGIYFAGEVIDIDGFTGGFNLQAAFSTGYLAGRSAAVL